MSTARRRADKWSSSATSATPLPRLEIGGSRRNQAEPDRWGTMASQAIMRQPVQISAGHAGEAPRRRLGGNAPASLSASRPAQVRRRWDSTWQARTRGAEASALPAASAAPTAGGRGPPAPAATQRPSAAAVTTTFSDPCQRDMRRLGPYAAAELNHRLQGQPGPVLPPGQQSQRIAPG